MSKYVHVAERGKYAEQYRAGTNLVLLAPDVAAAFPNDGLSAGAALGDAAGVDPGCPRRRGQKPTDDNGHASSSEYNATIPARRCCPCSTGG
ncbi:MAG: hypothetical protein R2856_17985 [Caldilineaceae bacterium]